MRTGIHAGPASTSRLEAYESCARGRVLFMRGEKVAFEHTQALFKQAIGWRGGIAER